MRNKPKKQRTLRLLAGLLWLPLWQLVSMVIGLDLLFPSPITVFSRLFALSQTWAFWDSVFLSLLRIMTGYLLAVIGGVVLCALTSVSRFALYFFQPLLAIIRATPVASFIILTLVFLPTNNVPVFTSFLMVLPLVWGNLTQGVQKTDPALLDMGRAFRFSRRKMLNLIYIPSALPYFMAACTTGLGLAWKAGIAAEVIAVPASSIGKQLYESKIYLETPDLFAWTVSIVALSMLLEKVFVALMARLTQGLSAKGGASLGT